MRHPSLDQLAQCALADTPPPRQLRRHLDTCARCQSEIADLSRLADILRAPDPVQAAAEAPPDAVWEAIAAELPSTERAGAPAPAEAGPSPSLPRPPTRAPRRPIRARLWVSLAVPALAFLLGIGAATAVIHTWNPPAATTPTTTQRAALTGLPNWPKAHGTATIQTTGQHRELVITLTAPPAAGYREVWLMSGNLKGAVSIGLLSNNTGRFTLPTGITTAQYPVVDISQQPDNGNPAHSGNSIVRGQF